MSCGEEVLFFPKQKIQPSSRLFKYRSRLFSRLVRLVSRNGYHWINPKAAAVSASHCQSAAGTASWRLSDGTCFRNLRNPAPEGRQIRKAAQQQGRLLTGISVCPPRQATAELSVTPIACARAPSITRIATGTWRCDLARGYGSSFTCLPSGYSA
jgi:hypothetical protein